MMKYILILMFLFLQNGDKFRAEKSDDAQPFEHFAKVIYQKLKNKQLCYDAFEKAISGYLQLKNSACLEKNNVLTLIDFSKSSKEKRLFVIDLLNKKVLFQELVTHGVNSGDKYATSFSNEVNSRKSSLGFYLTGRTYYGEQGYSLKLLGLEKGFNDNAFTRAIVIHGSENVNVNYIKQNGQLAKSLGCFAVSENVNDSIIQVIKEGSCMFVYFPDSTYLKVSNVLGNSA